MTPEVLQEKFLDWQCQSRIQAFRTQNGKTINAKYFHHQGKCNSLGGKCPD